MTSFDVIWRYIDSYINKHFRSGKTILEKIMTIFYANWMIFDEVIGLKVQITENSDTEKCKCADVRKKK